MIAAKLVSMPLGGAIYRSANLPTENVSQAEAAKLLNVSERTLIVEIGLIMERIMFSKVPEK
jgi:hypothetical protein